MNKNVVKKIAFFVLVLAFLALAPVLILNVQGYRFDFEKMRLVETGGLSIKTSIPEAGVSVNGQYKNKTSSFTRDLLIQNLAPGEYEIRVEKDGYHAWEKTLGVEEKKVTKMENIYLFPEEISFSVYKENIKDFFLPENKKTIFYLADDDQILSSENEIVLSSKEAKKYFTDIQKIEFFSNEEKILIKGINYLARTVYYYLDTATAPSSLAYLKFMEGIEDYELEEQSIVYQSKNQILRYDLDAKTIEVLKNKADAFAVKDYYNIYAIESGLLTITNLLSENQKTLSEKPLDLDKYKLLIISDKIFVSDKASSLYLLNEGEKEFEPFLKTTNGIGYEALSDKIIFSNGYELWLLLLRDFDSPFFQKSGSLVFLSRFSSKIENVSWFNSDYFFYVLKNNLLVSETDNRDEINAISVSDMPITKFWFDDKEKTLYVLSKNKIYASSKFNP
ncbi:MAG: PEGA domain-containing protein [Candidatus Pacebacteria bacterium]|nr:PEGA domain-containing protein [Candidatus Paceibacterota bacterium]